MAPGPACGLTSMPPDGMVSEEKQEDSMITFNHFNFNVKNLEESIAFYEQALGLRPVRETCAADGSYRIVFLGDGITEFRLELTWLAGHPQAYDLGECEFHLAFLVDEFEDMMKRHEEMGCICYKNEKMGIYFIEDPDGYWIEIVPARK